MNKIYIVSESFNRDSGQGIFKFAHYLYEELSKMTIVEKIEINKSSNKFGKAYNSTIGLINKCKDKNGIYLFMSPEYALASNNLKNSYVVVEDLIPLKYPEERAKSFNLFFKYLWGKVSDKRLIAISTATQEDVIENIYAEELNDPNLYTLPNWMRDTIKVIPLGVDHKLFKPLKRKKNAQFTIGYVGGFGKRKNVELIIDLARKFPFVLFKIAGKGNNVEKLKKIAPDNVVFMGYIDEKELGEYYNTLDLFIFPSLYEGFGLPTLESISCGTPVIVSDINVNKEVLGTSGTFANPEDLEDYAKKIELLINNKRKLNKLGLLGIKQAKKFSWNKMAKEYLKYIKETQKCKAKQS